MSRRNLPAARAAFAEVLRLNPDLHEPRGGLVSADVAERSFGAARQRLNE